MLYVKLEQTGAALFAFKCYLYQQPGLAPAVRLVLNVSPKLLQHLFR